MLNGQNLLSMTSYLLTVPNTLCKLKDELTDLHKILKKFIFTETNCLLVQKETWLLKILGPNFSKNQKYILVKNPLYICPKWKVHDIALKQLLKAGKYQKIWKRKTRGQMLACLLICFPDADKEIFHTWVYWKLFCHFWPAKWHNFAHVILSCHATPFENLGGGSTPLLPLLPPPPPPEKGGVHIIPMLWNFSWICKWIDGFYWYSLVKGITTVTALNKLT